MHSRIGRACALGVLVLLFTSALTGPAQAGPRPAAPTGLKATTTHTSAVLTWKPARHATKYRACLTVARDKPCTRFSPTSSKRSWTVTGLKATADTDYYFRVTAGRGSRTRTSPLKGFNLKPPVVPDAPTGIRQAVSWSKATISWPAARNATSYSVCLSGNRGLTRCARTSAPSATRSVTFTGLRPTGGGDYFYRVRSHRGSRSAASAVHRIDLPSSQVRSVSPARGRATGSVTASWPAAVNAEWYQFQIAKNSAMTSKLRTVTTGRTTASQSNLTIGTTYYFRVRAINNPSKGKWSPVRALRLPSLPARINVLTYNLCGQDKCVTRANRMKSWSTRRAYAGRIARGSGADIIATQESHDKDTRFGRELPGFGLAAYYSAKSLFYNKSKYDLRRSGKVTLSAKRGKYAVWAELRDSASRTSVLVVDVHLQPFKGRALDDVRSTQTKVLLRKIASINRDRLPVVYAGDFNSNKSNAQRRFPGGYDAPKRVFNAAGIVNSLSRATNPVHRTYNSANQAVNPPLRSSDHVDHIYIDPRISVRQWRVVVSMARNGRGYAKPFATDHNGVRAMLDVPGR
ncbi:hypothetical protein GEV27_14725 [Aeromicrobium sp. S22]|uniref:fibronectin type III domain-containing protein n=1 Tax=Aeromicrobium sp. S22 TaxID=2662029 RepID=UPI00129DA526|nr:fibronectin type III domain-containing protein [Aeromicrobium sp. S22]MRK02770.1 hypothetical protein [Aeromicrobium sp. S22]